MPSGLLADTRYSVERNTPISRNGQGAAAAQAVSQRRAALAFDKGWSNPVQTWGGIETMRQQRKEKSAPAGARPSFNWLLEMPDSAKETSGTDVPWAQFGLFSKELRRTLVLSGANYARIIPSGDGFAVEARRGGKLLPAVKFNFQELTSGLQDDRPADVRTVYLSTKAAQDLFDPRVIKAFSDYNSNHNEEPGVSRSESLCRWLKPRHCRYTIPASTMSTPSLAADLSSMISNAQYLAQLKRERPDWSKPDLAPCHYYTPEEVREMERRWQQPSQFDEFARSARARICFETRARTLEPFAMFEANPYLLELLPPAPEPPQSEPEEKGRFVPPVEETTQIELLPEQFDRFSAPVAEKLKTHMKDRTVIITATPGGLLFSAQDDGVETQDRASFWVATSRPAGLLVPTAQEKKAAEEAAARRELERRKDAASASAMQDFTLTRAQFSRLGGDFAEILTDLGVQEVRIVKEPAGDKIILSIDPAQNKHADAVTLAPQVEFVISRTAEKVSIKEIKGASRCKVSPTEVGLNFNGDVDAWCGIVPVGYVVQKLMDWFEVDSVRTAKDLSEMVDSIYSARRAAGREAAQKLEAEFVAKRQQPDTRIAQTSAPGSSWLPSFGNLTSVLTP